MKDSHKKRHETLRYKERRGDWDWLVGNVPSSGPIIMDPARSIKAVRGKSERNAERPGGCVAV